MTLREPLPRDVAALLDAAAQRYGVPRELARAVAWRESRGLQSARSRAGAIGVMQLMPGTAEGLRVDPEDLAENIDGGVRFLSHLLQRFDQRAAVAAYNWGPGNVENPDKSWPPSVVDYASDVLQRAEVERAAFGGGADPEAPKPFPFVRSPRRASPWSFSQCSALRPCW